MNSYARYYYLVEISGQLPGGVFLGISAVIGSYSRNILSTELKYNPVAQTEATENISSGVITNLETI